MHTLHIIFSFIIQRNYHIKFKFSPIQFHYHTLGKFLKFFFIFVTVFLSLLEAKDIPPTHKFHAIGLVSDFIIDHNKLYGATDVGTIDIFDLKTQQLLSQIILPPVTTAMGELVSARILSVDRYNNKTLIVSIGRDAFRNVWIYEEHSLKQIIDENSKLTIKEARFMDDERIILATFGSEIILHDTKEDYHIYKSHISQSTLGDIALNQNKTHMVLSDESGEIKLINLKDSSVEKTFASQNVDNVYHVAHSSGVIITAGQDRRVGVYQKDKKPYHIKSDFLVYCVGISPSGKIGVYSSGEENHLQLFDTKTKRKSHRLIGHKAIINQIHFINEKELYSADTSKTILYWKLP